MGVLTDLVSMGHELMLDPSTHAASQFLLLFQILRACHLRHSGSKWSFFLFKYAIEYNAKSMFFFKKCEIAAKCILFFRGRLFL